MNGFPYWFPLFFIALFISALFTLSKKGWADLAAAYRFDQPFQGMRHGIISAVINGVNYSNCLLLKYNEDGLYLRPVFIFQLFHPPIFIPWKEIKHVRDKKILFSQMKELVIGAPAIAIVQMTTATFSRIDQMKNLEMNRR